MNDVYAVVDIETTGNSPKNGERIIQIGIARIEKGRIVSTYSTFINPQKKIPPFIRDLTHIDDQDVQDAPLFEEIAEELYHQLDGAIFVAHNVNFDFPFIQGELKRCELPLLRNKKIDTVEFSRLMFPTALSYKLSEITLELGIRLDDAHRADADAYATAELFLKCIEKLQRLPYETIQKLHKRCFKLKSHVAPLFFEVLKTAEQRSIELTSTSEQLNSVAFPKYPSFEEEKAQLLQTIYPNSEARSGQYQYMDAVYSALEESKEIALEAETGIGKTMGYLIPSIELARNTNKKVLISTYTNTLMDQLVEKEIARLLAVYPGSFRAAKLKSPSHYLDRHQYHLRLSSEDESYDETFALMQVLVWIEETTTGDLSELNPSGGAQLTLDKLRKQERTPGYQDDYYERVLKDALAADIIVTNHAMLAQSPHVMKLFQHEISAVVIDEAHHFLTAVAKANERVLSFTDWKYLFSQFGFQEASQVGYKLNEYGNYRDRIQKLQMSGETVNLLFDEYIQTITNQIGKTRSKPGMSKISFELEDHIDLLKDFTAELNYFVQQLEEIVYLTAFPSTVVKEEISYWVRELRSTAYKWEEFVLNSDEEASWIEADKRSLPSSIIFHQRQYDWKEKMAEIMAPYRGRISIVWTSGTLTVPNQPWFLLDQLHLPKHVTLQKFHAPQDYYSGAKLFIVKDVPDVTQVDQRTFIESIADVIIQTVQATGGRTFVLFTSQDMLRKTVELIEETTLLDNFLFIAQGMNSGSKMRMLRTFQRFPKAVLFGTTTFWEGVDVPGEALSTLLMVRLPFTNPDEPYFKKKAEKLSSQGINPFSKLSLPEAIIRFRQGFGRLIRSSQEKGACIILDRRIETKSYGKEFLLAIPHVEKHEVSVESMVDTLESWYNS